MVSMQAQFFGGLKQKIIPVKDFSRESFKLFLHVLEGQRIHRPSMKFSSWFDPLCLADKYLVPGLEQFVVEQMMNNLRKQVGLDLVRFPGPLGKWVGRTNPLRAGNFTSEASSTENVDCTPPHIIHNWILQHVDKAWTLLKLV